MAPGEQRPRAVSAGTHPGSGVDPGAIRHLPSVTASRCPAAAPPHQRRSARRRPRYHSVRPGHEELGEALAVHWSVPDPALTRDPGSFDTALDQLADRVLRLAPSLVAHLPTPRGAGSRLGGYLGQCPLTGALGSPPGSAVWSAATGASTGPVLGLCAGAQNNGPNAVRECADVHRPAQIFDIRRLLHTSHPFDGLTE